MTGADIVYTTLKLYRASLMKRKERLDLLSC